MVPNFLPPRSARPDTFNAFTRPHVSDTFRIIPERSMQETARAARRNTPVAGGSLLASAARITASSGRIDRKRQGRTTTSARGWQEDAADMYDLVGELHYLTNTLAKRAAQARFYVGQHTGEPLAAPEPVEDVRLSALLDSLGDQVAFQQMIRRLALNLQVSGEGWLVGIPPAILEAHAASEQSHLDRASAGMLDRLFIDASTTTEATLEELEWRMCAVTELTFETNGGGDDVTVKIALDDHSTLEASLDDLYLVRIWEPHATNAAEPDCAVRAALPILRELDGLTRHVSAQIDSRLAGAGVFVVPASASRAFKQQAGLEDDPDADPLTDSLIEAMSEPIEHRDSASAFVPLVLTVPDESADKFSHLSFATPLDATAKELRMEALSRLALSLDAPPELLLGTAAMNHWGAWLVSEEVVSSHIDPPLALICDALTAQFLRPAMRAQGYSEEEIARTFVWFDTEHLIVRPSRPADARDLFDRGELSGDALRVTLGFDADDAPQRAATGASDPVIETVLKMVTAAPSLAANPGLTALAQSVRELLASSSSYDTPENIPSVSAPITVDNTSPAPLPSPEGLQELPSDVLAALLQTTPARQYPTQRSAER